MPIAKLKPESRSPKLPQIPEIEPPKYKSVVIDEKNIPRETLLAYIAGSSWTVDYYQQVINRDNDLKEYDVLQDEVYQQYTLISKLELRVESELSSSMDTEKALTTITGSALLYPNIIPNVGDVFVAESGKGRTGMFSITNVERKTFNKQSTFAIEYTCIAFMDEEFGKFHNLRKKVIRELVFNKDRLLNGGMPILTKDEDMTYSYLADIYPAMIDYYVKSFFNKNINTFALPGQLEYTYDHYVTKFFVGIVGTNCNSELLKLRIYNVENDTYLNQAQIYDVLLERDVELLSSCNRYMTISTTERFHPDPLLQSLRYAMISGIVYPTDMDKTNEHTEIDRRSSTRDFEECKSPKSDLSTLVDNEHIPPVYDHIKPVTIDDCYVFSNEFYMDSYPLSILEELTMDYLHHRAVNISKLSTLCKRYRSWGRLEQFYYIPILLLLIKHTSIALY